MIILKQFPGVLYKWSRSWQQSKWMLMPSKMILEALLVKLNSIQNHFQLRWWNNRYQNRNSMTHLFIDSGRCSPSKMKRPFFRFKSNPFLAMSSLLSADHRWYSSTVLPWKLMTNFIWWHNCWQCHVTHKNQILPPRQRRNQTTNPIRIEWKNNLMKSTSWFWFIWTRSIFGSFFLLKMAIFWPKMTGESGRCGWKITLVAGFDALAVLVLGRSNNFWNLTCSSPSLISS